MHVYYNLFPSHKNYYKATVKIKYLDALILTSYTVNSTLNLSHDWF